MQSYLHEFEMWVLMVKLGSDSKEFKSSPGFQIYKDKELDIRVPQGSKQVVGSANKIIAKKESLIKNINSLIANQKEYARYSTTIDGKTYKLNDFMNAAIREQELWYEDMKDAANVGKNFTGEKDCSKYSPWKMGRFI